LEQESKNNDNAFYFILESERTTCKTTWTYAIGSGSWPKEEKKKDVYIN